MSWHYLQAQGEESSEPICSDGEPLPPLRSKTTHGEFCCNGKLMESYLASLSGTMSGHSTENPGEEGSMSYLEGSPARTSVPQEKGLESAGNDPDSGVKWHALSVKFDPDTYSLRTHHCLFPEDLQLSSVTLPKWGSLHDGELWERITPVPLTSATDAGSWPTPRSCSAMAATITPENSWAEGRFPNLETVVGQRLWPTPTSQEAGIIENLVTKDGAPAKPGERAYNPKTGKYTQVTLNRAVQMWPTPTGEKFATPQSRDFRTGSQERYDDPARTKNLNDQIGGQLNPDWVEWLMGWPIGWTDLKPLAMDKFRQWLRSHGKSSTINLEL